MHEHDPYLLLPSLRAPVCDVSVDVTIAHFASKTRFKRANMSIDTEDQTTYRVVINHEEQYSIWSEHRPAPLGWRDAGKSGSKSECLAYIKEVWTDMRPLSIRDAIPLVNREV